MACFGHDSCVNEGVAKWLGMMHIDDGVVLHDIYTRLYVKSIDLVSILGVEFELVWSALYLKMLILPTWSTTN